LLLIIFTFSFCSFIKATPIPLLESEENIQNTNYCIGELLYYSQQFIDFEEDYKVYAEEFNANPSLFYGLIGIKWINNNLSTAYRYKESLEDILSHKKSINQVLFFLLSERLASLSLRAALKGEMFKAFELFKSDPKKY
jgi:hypothetical protein